MSTTTIDGIPGQQKGLAPEIRRLSLRYPELSDSEIARKVGCTPSNVSQVLAAFLKESTREELEDFQSNKADIYDVIQKQILGSISEAKILKAGLAETVTAAAILEDKARLVRGQATGINVNVLMDVVEAIKARRQ